MHVLLSHMAAGSSPVFNIGSIQSFITSGSGIAIALVGLVMLFRGLGQQAHRHVMSMGLVVLAGLAILGVGITGTENHIATELANTFFK